MSVMEKFENLRMMKKKDLRRLKEEVETKLIDLEAEKDELTNELANQRASMLEKIEEKKTDEAAFIKIKIEILEKTYSERVADYKDKLETGKAIEQIFKLREERKHIARSKWLGLCGVVVSTVGIGLGYGTDLLGTITNKNTLQAAKDSINRFIPKFH